MKSSLGAVNCNSKKNYSSNKTPICAIILGQLPFILILLNKVNDDDHFVKSQFWDRYIILMISKTEKIRTVVSATIIMITLGSLYTFGAIIPYLSSYLYYQGNQTSSASLAIVYTMATVNMNVGMFIDSFLKKKQLSNRQICIVSIVILSLSIFLTSLMKQLIGLIIFFGILNGIGMGIGYTCPLRNSYYAFPDRKGFCAGFCMAGFGFGSVIFNQVILQVINPQDKQINPDTQLFPQQVANNVPLAFKILGCLYLVLGGIGIVLMKDFEAQIKAEDQHLSIIEQKTDEQQAINPKNLPQEKPYKIFFRNKGLWIYLLIFSIMQFNSFMAFAFKEIGFVLNPAFDDKDYALTIAGDIGILVNGLSRYLWGYLSDYFCFRKLITIINGMMIVAIFTIQLTSLNIITYCLPIIISFASLGGVFSLLPSLILKMFGQILFAKLYWVTFMGFTSCSIFRLVSQLLIINNIEGKQGYLYCIYLLGVFQVIGFFVGFCVDFESVKIEERPQGDMKVKQQAQN